MCCRVHQQRMLMHHSGLTPRALHRIARAVYEDWGVAWSPYEQMLASIMTSGSGTAVWILDNQSCTPTASAELDPHMAVMPCLIAPDCWQLQ